MSRVTYRRGRRPGVRRTVARAPGRRRRARRRTARGSRNAGTAGQHVALPVLQPLAIFELAQSSATPTNTLESVPTPNWPPPSRNSRVGKIPSPRLASVSGQSPAIAPLPGESGGLRRSRMGRMDQAPARINGRMFEQPLDRPSARPGDAFLDFPDLFSGMDMHRSAFGQRRDRS